MDAFLRWIFVDAPFWLIAVSVFALMWAGYLAGRALSARLKSGDAEGDSGSLSVTTVLGLLALLLGFTFSLALDRYDRRRELVRDEALAIRTTYLRAGTFAEPHRDEIRQLLRRYVDVRVALGEARQAARKIELSNASDALQHRLWQATEHALIGNRDDVASSFMESTNNVIEVDAARRIARQARVPPRVLGAILFYMAISAALVGYELGNRRRGEVLVMLGLTTTAYLLIIDIDDAVRGGVQESQAAMIELRAAIAGIGP